MEVKNFPGSKPNSLGKLSDGIHEEEFKWRDVLLTSCLNDQWEMHPSCCMGHGFMAACAEHHQPSVLRPGCGVGQWLLGKDLGFIYEEEAAGHQPGVLHWGILMQSVADGLRAAGGIWVLCTSDVIHRHCSRSSSKKQWEEER